MKIAMYVLVVAQLMSVLICTPLYSADYRSLPMSYEGALYTGCVAINSSGEVLMGAMMDGYHPRTLIWQQGSDPVPAMDDVYPRDLNAARQIVGYTSSTGAGSHAFIFDATTSTMTDLTTIGEEWSDARSINDRGQVILNVGYPDRSWSSFVWSKDGGKSPVGYPAGSVIELNGINQIGQIAGTGIDGDDRTRAFIWNEGLGATDIGDLGDGWSRAYAINDAGQIAGTSGIDAEHYGMFVWDPQHRMSMALKLPYHVLIEISGINSAGVVVGDIVDNQSEMPQHHAFVWTEREGLTLFGVGGASDVNDRGQIVGSIGGQAFLWEPVPEPSSLMALGMGLVPIAGMWVRRRRAQITAITQ